MRCLYSVLLEASFKPVCDLSETVCLYLTGRTAEWGCCFFKTWLMIDRSRLCPTTSSWFIFKSKSQNKLHIQGLGVKWFRQCRCNATRGHCHGYLKWELLSFGPDRSLLNDECAKLKLLDKGTSNRSNRSSLLENCTANELERHQRILQSFRIRGGPVARGQFLYHQYSELPGLPYQCFEEYRKHCWRKIRRKIYYDRENKERR